MWSHRVVRHTVFICASQSLSVQASACRSSVPPHCSLDEKCGGGTLVFVDVENLNTVRYTAWHTHILFSVLSNLTTNYCPNFVLICLLLAPRVTLGCMSSTSSRCPAVVNTGVSTGVSTQQKRKVGLVHWVICILALQWSIPPIWKEKEKHLKIQSGTVKYIKCITWMLL